MLPVRDVGTVAELRELYRGVNERLGVKGPIEPKTHLLERYFPEIDKPAERTVLTVLGDTRHRRAKRIIQAKLEQYKITAEEFFGDRRSGPYVKARWEAIVAVYEMEREVTGKELAISELARIFRRDPTTVYNALVKAGVKGVSRRD